ncbi:MAG: thioesterase family protein [Candidatus Sericytochromatia bacterium]|nr:thioesterase family protein [Candidatus Sericytochromatia bacterium]
MRLPSPVDEPIRVRYAETDAQGIVYHANHVIYFEVGRGAFLRAQGFDYNAFEAGGHLMVVADVSVKYRAPARYDDALVVRTSLEEVGWASLVFAYRLQKGETLVAEGRSTHVCLDRTGRPVALPADLRAALEGPAGLT